MATIKACSSRLVPVALLLCGLIVMGSISGLEAKDKDGKVCIETCQEAYYMTCPSTGNAKLNPACNCCLASLKEDGCTIYLKDGTVEKCPRT
ncbi:proteinase inhibitor type-2 CEVI57 [Sorghum bicolor]|uniref:Bowman-Birk serine protease inhibitors family domain-containing protein n=1 Tax=Sorghum bicolor TaxID=4558 RepID=C5WLW2_SORBI|nr:proteinase inhibitor type-2 CEVI57 [Sorghum bicolor]EER90920.1 hypothetical protein SORBI_3001G100200 [Sorghum bicolor]|eukprot:XP_002463922.1 proteinase inhibitor type-2 CEVI57 [Sorghum bicolor]